MKALLRFETARETARETAQLRFKNAQLRFENAQLQLAAFLGGSLELPVIGRCTRQKR